MNCNSSYKWWERWLRLFSSQLSIFTWQASCPASPPAQKLLAGRMKIFSVTVLIFLTHSLSLTMGTLASRILSGMGPAKNTVLIVMSRWWEKVRVTETSQKSGVVWCGVLVPRCWLVTHSHISLLHCKYHVVRCKWTWWTFWSLSTLYCPIRRNYRFTGSHRRTQRPWTR